MPWEAWTLIGVSVAAGAAFKARGLLVPVAYVTVLYIIERAGGAFVNHSHNGDNLEALAFYGVVIWLAIGVFVALLGWGLRALADLLYRALGHPGTRWQPGAG